MGDSNDCDKERTSTAGISHHLVVRFSDSLTGADTIGRHQEVIQKKKAVWLAKQGQPLGHAKIRILNDQIEAGVPTFVFLVSRQFARYEWHRGTLLRVAGDVPPHERCLIPRYYVNCPGLKSARLWLKMSCLTPAPDAELNSLHVASSGSDIYTALHASIAGMFFVLSGADQGRQRQLKHRRLEDAVLDAFSEEW